MEIFVFYTKKKKMIFFNSTKQKINKEIFEVSNEDNVA